MKHLIQIVSQDVQTLREKDTSYGGSWKKRGGVGAFMMMARKWDRLETQATAFDYDIFQAVFANTASEGPLDDIRDLRAYLLLIEDFCLAQMGVEVVDVEDDLQITTEALNDGPLIGAALYHQMAPGGTCDEEAYKTFPAYFQECMVGPDEDGRYQKVGSKLHADALNHYDRLYRTVIAFLQETRKTGIVNDEMVDRLRVAVMNESQNVG